MPLTPGTNTALPPAGPESGFTLLECLVALVILGVALSVLLPTFGDGLRSGSRARETVLATLHAKSLLDEIPVIKNGEPGDWQGTFADRYRWRARIVEYKKTEAEDYLQPLFEVEPQNLRRLIVAVSAPGSSRNVVLTRLLFKVGE